MVCMDTTALTSLVALRSAQHTICGRRRDALFDLCDALLAAGPVTSPAHLSLQPQHRRGWGSVYDALAVGAISGPEVEALLAEHPLAGGEPIYAVDASVWARCAAETSPGRAVYYHPSRHSAGKPVVAGWAYHWIAQLSFARTSPHEPARAGPLPSACAACTHRRIPTPLLGTRFATSCVGCPLLTLFPGSSLMRATTRCSWRTR
jgi:hypothetical protein